MVPMRRTALLVVASLLTGCAAAAPQATQPAPAAPPAPSVVPPAWPDPPAVPDGRLERSVREAVDRLVAGGTDGAADRDALATMAASGDARLAWLVSDLLRMTVTSDGEAALVAAFRRLTGADPRDPRYGPNAWLAVTNLLIGWDLPAPPDYRAAKAALLLAIEPAWEPFFADAGSTIDWRVTTWGGVFADDRPAGSTEPCRRACIPALDDPALTAANEGGWYADDRVVFGIVVGDEAVALPKHIMEVHELVNLTLGRRRIGVPYCTLCASAQAFLTDAHPLGPDPLVLRTSGLLSRSNKVMFDLASGSAFHTFTGRAASGPLREAGFVLEPVNVTVATWGDWRAAHPETRIVARDGGIGRTYPDDPLCGRDASGPIFPIGPADTRLPAQAMVVGVIAADGRPVAFAAERARAALDAGRPVSLAGVELALDGGGVGARGPGGDDLVPHQSYWFAWSQFHPDTALWAPPTATGEVATPTAVPARPAVGCEELLDVLDP